MGKGTSLITATYRGKTVYCRVTVMNEVKKPQTTNAVSDLQGSGMFSDLLFWAGSAFLLY